MNTPEGEANSNAYNRKLQVGGQSCEGGEHIPGAGANHVSVASIHPELEPIARGWRAHYTHPERKPIARGVV
eukprot:1188551-Prorocentrum_minimum.AAC.6